MSTKKAKIIRPKVIAVRLEDAPRIELERMAGHEHRSLANMAALLIIEAVAARRKQK